MTALPLSLRLRLWIPSLLGLLLLFVCLVPLQLGEVPMSPHPIWLMTLTIGVLFPPAWPVTASFFLGLLADFLMGTPLGSQALLSLFLTLLVQAGSVRSSHQLFPLRWLEAAGVLVVWHLLLWLIAGWVISPRPPLQGMLIAGAVSALWFPLFYALALGLLKLLPARA